MSGAPRRVLLADDSAELRAVIRSLLEREGIEVVAEAGDGAAVLDAAAHAHPDVVVLDAGMPGTPPAAVIAALGASERAPAVVVYSGLPVAELESLGVPVVPKGADPAALVRAVTGAGAGGADG
jgi:DNA-binding NarL/FixJ family response regulator